MRFDGDTGLHYHIRCLGCGRINDLPMSIDAMLEEQAGRAMNYEILTPFRRGMPRRRQPQTHAKLGRFEEPS